MDHSNAPQQFQMFSPHSAQLASAHLERKDKLQSSCLEKQARLPIHTDMHSTEIGLALMTSVLTF